jgi:hypothetical protein
MSQARTDLATPPVGHYSPVRMTSASDEQVSHLNGYRIQPGTFPPGSRVEVRSMSIAHTIRVSWRVLLAAGFQVADQRPPVLPVTHRWITDSTPHGTILAEKDIVPIPSGLLERRRYSSTGILVTIDADDSASSATGATIETPVLHLVRIEGGTVQSRFERGKHHTWRTIERVGAAPSVSPIISALAEALQPPLP